MNIFTQLLKYDVTLLMLLCLPVLLSLKGFWPVERRRILVVELSSNMANAALFGLLIVFWCLLLEFRRRRLAELLEGVSSIEVETCRVLSREPPAEETVRTCVSLLESSCSRYDRLQLLQDALHKTRRDLDQPAKLVDIQHPPIVEESFADIHKDNS